MLARFGRITSVALLVVLAVALCAFGFLTLSAAALLSWTIVAGFAGLGVAIYAWTAPAEPRLEMVGRALALGPLRLGIGVFVAAAVGSLLLTGLVTAVGVGSALVLLLTAFAVAGWWWRWRGGPAWPVTAEPPAAPPEVPATSPEVLLAAATVSLRLEQSATPDLCTAWRRSYWLLLDLPACPLRDQLVGVRECLLDELERRDPRGFRQWLTTGARAGSDPGRYLIG